MAKESKFWLYTHNFTHSGAPLVLAAIARELAAAGLCQQLRIVSWGGLHDHRHSTLQHQLIAEGIGCQVLDFPNPPPQINSGDRLLLNTVALPDPVVQQALAWLAEGKLQRLDWYAHESDPEIWIQNDTTHLMIVEALRSGRMQMRVPSQRVCLAYEQWLGFTGKALDVQCPALESSSFFEGIQPLNPGHFGDLRLVLVGSAGYGNKGHLWLLHLLEAALSDIPNGARGLRPIQLSFLGLETGHYAALSREVIRRAESLLGDQFSWHESCQRDKLLSLISKSNLLVNCSLKEAFSCVSVEAMAMGLPLLRIQNGGHQEQLIDGVTGFDLGSPSPGITLDQVQLINHLRDPLAIPDSKLLDMVAAAKTQGKKFTLISYSDWLL